MGGVAGDPSPYLLGLRVVLEELVLAETRGGGLHLHEYSAVFLFGLCDPALAEGRHGAPVLHLLLLVRGKGGISGKGADSFQLVQQLYVLLSDLVVLFVVLMRKRPALAVLDLLMPGESMRIEGKLVLPLLSNPLQLLQMRLVEPR